MFLLVHKFFLENIRDVELAVSVVLGNFARRRSRFLIHHKVKCGRELLRSTRLKTFVHRVRIIFEAMMALLKPIKVEFLRVERNVLPLTKLTCLSEMCVAIHLVNIYEGG